MAYNKNLNIGPNNVVSISGSLVTITGSLSGSQISGTTAQFTSLTASNLNFGNNLYVSGGVTIGNYVQLLPVGPVIIPTNQTASYIYTSGSTNDMYFTQYQPSSSFNNTTRLRWLESTLSTGLLHGGVLSTVNGTTTFNLTSGSGLIVNYNASTGSDPYPTIQFVNWTASVSQSLTYVTASQISYISLDQHGEILQSPTPPTFAQYKDRIFIGRVLHQSGSVTNGATNTPPTAYGLATSTADLIRAIGPLKIAGHYLAASGSSLSLTKSAGDSYVEGRNYSGNPNIPNIVSAVDDPAVTVSKIYRQHVSGGNPVIDTGIANAGYTEVDPTKYQDANGNLINVGNNKFSVQRVFWFPKAVNRALFVYYGQALYDNLDDAIAGISTENFTEGENTRGSAILVAFLVMKGNVSNFDTSSTARIYQAGTLRGGGAGGGGSGGGGGTTLPAGSSSYVQFNDVGSFGADSGFTFNKITHALTVTGTGSFGSLSSSHDVIAVNTVSGSTATFTTLTASNAYIASNLGVGTSTPSTKLDVNGNTLITGSLTVITSSGVCLQTFESTDLAGSSKISLNQGSSGRNASITYRNSSAGISGLLGNSQLQLNTDVSASSGMLFSTAIAGAPIVFSIGGTAAENEKLRINSTAVSVSGNLITTGNLTTTGSTILSTVSGTTAQFTLITGSTVTGSTALFTTITGSITTGSTAQFTTLSGTNSNISNDLFVNNRIIISSNNITASTAIQPKLFVRQSGFGSPDYGIRIENGSNGSYLSLGVAATASQITSSGDLSITTTGTNYTILEAGRAVLLYSGRGGGDKGVYLYNNTTIVAHTDQNNCFIISGTVGSTTQGRLRFANSGSAATPLITQGNLTGSGIYFPTADTVAFSTNAVERMRITGSGDIVIANNLTVSGSITELSTRRIKTNIETLNNQLTTISKLNPVSYTRIDDGRKEYGFISEEVKQVYPEFVVGEGINYPKMVSVLVSAVKELTDKIEKQQTEIELLKNKKKTVRGKK